VTPRGAQLRHWLLIALAAIATAVLPVSQAGAGQVYVTPDFNNGFSWGANGWSNGLGGFSLLLDGVNSSGQQVGPPGSFMWVRTPRVPADVSISAVYDTVRYHSPYPGTFAMRLCQPGVFDINTGGCASIDRNTVRWPSGSNLTVSGGVSCHVGRCDAAQLEVATPQSDGRISFTADSVLLTDNTAPLGDASFADNDLAGEGWLRGEVRGGLAVAEPGGVGVASSTLVIDGIDRAAKYYACDYRRWTPCPQSGSWSPTVNSGDFADGPHHFSFRTSDAASTTGSTATATFHVDNTRPDVPTGLTTSGDGLNGWSSTNTFDASWTNGAETVATATQSGLAKVRVDVEPTDPVTQINPPAIDVPIGETVSGVLAGWSGETVHGISAPAKGLWTVKISVIDKVGNVSPAGAENTIGYGDAVPLKTPGRSNGWVSRNELASSSVKQKWDPPFVNSGQPPICGYGVKASASPVEDGPASINVAAPTTEWDFPKTLTEGAHWIHIRTINCSKIPAAETEHIEAKVDLTDPIPSFSGVEEGRWYKDGQLVTLAGSDTLSGMAGADPQQESDSTRGAYINYELNGNGPARADSPRGGSAELSVSGEGLKTLSFAPVDLAGNEPARTVVRFGIDATNPEGYLDAQDPGTPTLLRAPVGDALSGIGRAHIAVRNTEGGGWHELATSLASIGGAAAGAGPHSGVAIARFPDTTLKGRFEVRVVAFDQAGNLITTSRDRNGNTKYVTNTDDNPMRINVGLSASIFKALRKCNRAKKQKRANRARRCPKQIRRRGKVYFQGGKAKIKVRWKRAAVVQGYLVGSGYRPIKGQSLELATRAAGKDEVDAGRTSTNSTGAFSFRVRPGVSRSVRVDFPGSETIKPASASVKLETLAHVSLKVSERRIRSGGRVTFRGRVSTFDRAYPAAGKIVTLQYLTRRKWRPAVAIVRTNKNGHFKASYRFGRIPAGQRARISFRIWAPTEAGFSHASTPSRTRIVRVN
jgi:hypothetical protein